MFASFFILDARCSIFPLEQNQSLKLRFLLQQAKIILLIKNTYKIIIFQYRASGIYYKAIRSK